MKIRDFYILEIHGKDNPYLLFSLWAVEISLGWQHYSFSPRRQSNVSSANLKALLLSVDQVDAENVLGELDRTEGGPPA